MQEHASVYFRPAIPGVSKSFFQYCIADRCAIPSNSSTQRERNKVNFLIFSSKLQASHLVDIYSYIGNLRQSHYYADLRVSTIRNENSGFK